MIGDSALLEALDFPYHQRVQAVGEALGKPLRMLSREELIVLVTTADPVTGPSTWLLGSDGMWGVTATAKWPRDITLLARVHPDGLWRGLLIADETAWPIGLVETDESIDLWISSLQANWVVRAMAMLITENWDSIHPRE